MYHFNTIQAKAKTTRPNNRKRDCVYTPQNKKNNNNKY